jgi:hypothetical protein
MIIPNIDHFNISYHQYVDDLEGVWDKACLKLTMKYGVVIIYGTEKIDGLTRIYFEVNGHQFESYNDVKRALDNRAYL